MEVVLALPAENNYNILMGLNNMKYSYFRHARTRAHALSLFQFSFIFISKTQLPHYFAMIYLLFTKSRIKGNGLDVQMPSVAVNILNLRENSVEKNLPFDLNCNQQARTFMVF